MKKNIIVILVSILILFWLILIFLNIWNNKSDSVNNFVKSKSKLNSISSWLVTDLPQEQIKKESKHPFENVPVRKDLIVVNDKKHNPKKELSLVEKYESYWYNSQLDNYLKAICWKKTNINDITCNGQFSFLEPRLYFFLLDTKKKLEISFDDIMNFLVAWIQRNCSQVKWENLELLIRAIKKNDTTCTKEIENIYNKKYKELSDLFKNYQLTEKTFSKPFKLYYQIPVDLSDVQQRNLQILILENINKQAKEKYWTIENFKNKMMDYENVESIDNLRENILKDYENLFKRYKLEDCWLKLEGYVNYFVWIPIEKKALKCFKDKKLLDNWFKEDYNKLMEKINLYTYLTKTFLWEKALAKALFWPEWVWITNLLDINAVLQWN
jgi:hypothetical protein